MAYLEEDILYNNVEEKYKVAKGEARNAYSDVLDTICEMPRADVVPKSEIEKIFEDIEISLKRSKKYDLRSGTYFECYLEGYIANLKKKHTEKLK